MSENSKLILIEGLDLAGKTSACESLAAHLRPRPDHRRNAFADKNQLYLVADELRRADGLSGEFLGHAYLAAAALDMTLFHPPSGGRIQESTIALRSLAHYRARGETDLADGFARILDDQAFPQFAGAVVLTASIEARQWRLGLRRQEAPEEIAPDDLAVVRHPDLFLRMEEIIVTEAVARFGARVIDTSMLTKSEVLQAIVAALPTVRAGQIRNSGS